MRGHGRGRAVQGMGGAEEGGMEEGGVVWGRASIGQCRELSTVKGKGAHLSIQSAFINRSGISKKTLIFN